MDASASQLRELPIPAARYALTSFHPAAPVLRVRYRDGVVVGGLGFPIWTPYARAIVQLPDVPAGRGSDEMRVLDVVAANEALGSTDRATPYGWVWAHQGRTRQLALIPADLHGSFAHLGGVSTMGADRSRHGVDVTGAAAVGWQSTTTLPELALMRLEEALGYRLPVAYRNFLLASNGARPTVPAVHPRFGFVADQYLFGLAREDWMEDLLYANGWFAERLTPDFLVLGYLQGGLLVLRVRGADLGSVWYLDDDDYRDADTYDARHRTEHLLHRVADDFTDYWDRLRAVPDWLRRLASDLVTTGAVHVLDVPGTGASLPRNLRPAEHAHQPPVMVMGAHP